MQSYNVTIYSQINSKHYYEITGAPWETHEVFKYGFEQYCTDDTATKVNPPLPKLQKGYYCEPPYKRKNGTCVKC